MARAKKHLNKNKHTKRIEGKRALPEAGYTILGISLIGSCAILYDLNTSIGNGVDLREGLRVVAMFLVFGSVGWMGLSQIWTKDITIDGDHIEITRTLFSRWTLRTVLHPDDINKITVGRSNLSKVRNQWTIMYIFIQLDPLWRLRFYKLNYNHFTEEQLLRMEQLLRGFPEYEGRIEEKRSRPYSTKGK